MQGVLSEPDPGGCGISILKKINDFEKRDYTLSYCNIAA